MRVRIVLLLALVILCQVQGHGHAHGTGQEHSHSHGHSHESPSYKYSAEANQQYSKIDPYAIWQDVILSVLLISTAPVVFLYFIPDLASRSGLLKILLGFAAGGLLGDAFLHLIPHSLEQMIHLQKEAPHGHSHSLDSPQMRVGCYVLAGILIFLFIEKLLLTLNRGSGHSHDNKKATKGSKGKDNNQKPSAEDEHYKISAFLNLIADFTHNFTDGLAIGASFLVNRNVGFVTTATVLFHELPHEIGDYAILMQSGYSRRKAMLLQLVTAIGALIGASLSLITAGINIGFSTQAITKDNLEMTSRGILPVTAGGFIYIAMVTVMPSLLKKSSQSSFLQNLGEILALFSGIGLMILVSMFE